MLSFTKKISFMQKKTIIYNFSKIRVTFFCFNAIEYIISLLTINRLFYVDVFVSFSWNE